MTRFASNTSVPVERSRGEIERVLVRYGADQFVYGWQHMQATVGFRANGRVIRFQLPYPKKNDNPRFDQEVRQRWRALLLVIKAKLEAVESEIATFDEEFLAHVVLPDGGTVGDWLLPQLSSSSTMPTLLPANGERR